MGILNGTSVYLVGAVDHAEDPRKWRRELTENVLHPLGVKVYDPLIKPSWFLEQFPVDADIDPALDFLAMKKLLVGDHNFSDEVASQIEDRMWGVRELCLRYASDCSFMIVNMPKQYTVGSLEEVQVAADAGKPIFVVLPDGPATSTWLPAQIYDSIAEFREYSFESMSELSKQIESIDSGHQAVNTMRWIFLHYFMDQDVENELTSHIKIRN